jgi:hypothetical protein
MGQLSESHAEAVWSVQCIEQGWNAESQINLLENFIRLRGLFSDFTKFAAEVAEQENASCIEAVGEFE